MSVTEQLTASGVILDSLSDGVYVCDMDRRIVFWSKAAERITGWSSSDVVGRRCLDDVLCHIDKDGHRLCGKEFCPLHRAMVTGTQSTVGLTVFGKGKSGHRIPMQVAVAPIHDAAGRVIGGVETFREMTEVLADLNRAKRIQSLSLEMDLPTDPRINFNTHYIPHDVVGGDFYAIRRLDSDRYGFMLADVMGHGVAAALYTMHLSSVWKRLGHLLADPIAFAQSVNAELAHVVGGESFATAVCGVINADSGRIQTVSAGGPSALKIRGADMQKFGSSGLPLGMVEDADYELCEAHLEPGDCLLFFTDGAVEVQNSEGAQLGVHGLASILRDLGFPSDRLQMGEIEERLLRYSNGIRLTDDLTFIEIEFVGGGRERYSDDN